MSWKRITVHSVDDISLLETLMTVFALEPEGSVDSVESCN
jgi:hypothetical protein